MSRCRRKMQVELESFNQSRLERMRQISRRLGPKLGGGGIGLTSECAALWPKE